MKLVENQGKGECEGDSPAYHWVRWDRWPPYWPGARASWKGPRRLWCLRRRFHAFYSTMRSFACRDDPQSGPSIRLSCEVNERHRSWFLWCDEEERLDKVRIGDLRPRERSLTQTDEGLERHVGRCLTFSISLALIWLFFHEQNIYQTKQTVWGREKKVEKSGEKYRDGDCDCSAAQPPTGMRFNNYRPLTVDLSKHPMQWGRGAEKERQSMHKDREREILSVESEGISTVESWESREMKTVKRERILWNSSSGDSFSHYFSHTFLFLFSLSYIFRYRDNVLLPSENCSIECWIDSRMGSFRAKNRAVSCFRYYWMRLRKASLSNSLLRERMIQNLDWDK